MTSPKDKLEALVEMAEDDALRREILETKEEDLDQELAEAGVDVARVRERAAKRKAEILEAAKVVPLASRRRGGTPWTLVLAAAAVAVLAIGYAWKTSRPRPEDDMADNRRSPVEPPSTAPSSEAPGLDIRGNPTAEPTDDLVAHSPPRPCKPLGARAVRLGGTISREGERFVLVPDDPVCGPDKASLDALDLEPANPKVELGRFGVEHIGVEGRIAARDGGGIVVRVDRASPR